MADEQEEINESQEVKDILRQLDEFRLNYPTQTKTSSPLTDNASSIVSPCSSRSAFHQVEADSLRHEHDQNEWDHQELDHWTDSTEEDGSDSTAKHLHLLGARHFLDPNLFVPSTLDDSPNNCKEYQTTATDLLYRAHVEREKTRRWAEKMRKAVENWARVRMNVHTVAIQTLEDQLTEALQNIRRQEDKIKRLEALVAKFQKKSANECHDTVAELAKVDATSLQTPQRVSNHPNRNITMTSTTLPPPTVSPSSPLSDNSATNDDSIFFDRLQPKEETTANSYTRLDTTTNTSKEPKSKQHRKRRIQKSNCEIIEYSNGATREIYADHEVLRHRNKDVEIIYSDHCRYYYAESKTLRITDSQKTTYYYSNSQSEIHWNDGRKLIRFADGTMHEVEHSTAATV